jgi:hypothetical protein
LNIRHANVTFVHIHQAGVPEEVRSVDWIDITVFVVLVLLVTGLAAVFSTARPKRRRGDDDGDNGGLAISAAATSSDRSRSRSDWDTDGDGDD